MTEEEWLACMDLKAMVTFLKSKAIDQKPLVAPPGFLRRFFKLKGKGGLPSKPASKSPVVPTRKLRLFNCACFRMEHGDCILNESEEQFADGMIHIDSLVAAYEGVGDQDPTDALDCAHMDPYTSAYYLEDAYGRRPHALETTPLPEQVRLAWCNLLRDIFGNPFRLAAIDPAILCWNDGTPVKIAQAIYEGRAFDGLPILADALEEAGCDDEDMLAHLRGVGPHVRGCWPLDLILGKS